MASHVELDRLHPDDSDERSGFIPSSETTSCMEALGGDESTEELKCPGSAEACEEFISEWPQGPREIEPKDYTWWIGAIGEVIMTVTPVVFFGNLNILQGDKR